jgi:hypothetical protein
MIGGLGGAFGGAILGILVMILIYNLSDRAISLGWGASLAWGATVGLVIGLTFPRIGAFLADVVSIFIP